jgi:FkbM family methyltransferase
VISYAQNFEDVMLWRALGHVEQGFYIDIGANDPVVDSVSLMFHERGWHGIHVEPMTYYAELLRQQRPGDQIIQAAVGTESAIIRFYEIPGEGISTADPEIAQQHRDRGFEVNEVRVPAITLNSIFESCDSAEIHWLKIDVEGFEKQVITSWAPSKYRPWVVVVESTLPLTQIQTHRDWQSILIKYGYTAVYFDGLNRYYLSKEHPELKKHFSSPPNVFDDFTLNGTAHAPFHRHIEMRYGARIVEMEAQNAKQQHWAQSEIERLTNTYAEFQQKADAQEASLKEQLSVLNSKDQIGAQHWAQREKEHSEQIQHIKQEIENSLRAQVRREQELSAQILSIQKQVDTEKTALHQHYQTLTETIQREHADYKWLTAERIEALDEELRQAHEEKIQREQEYAEQLLEVLPKTDAEKSALHQHYQAQLDTVQRERAEHEWLSGERIYALNEALHQLQAEKTQREQGLFEQILHGQQQADTEKGKIHQHYQAQLERIKREQDEYRWLTAERIQNLNDAVQGLQSELARREQIHNEQLLAARHQAEADKSALRAHYQARMSELQRERAEHEWLTGEKLHTLNEELQRLHIDRITQEQAHAEQLFEIQKTHREITEELGRHKEKENGLRQEYGEREQILNQQVQAARQELGRLEQQLKAEIQAEQQASLRLRQALAEVQQTLAATQATLTWRITAPLRTFASLITRKKPLGTAPLHLSPLEETAIPPIVMPSISEAQPSLEQPLSLSIEPIMPATTQTAHPTSPVVATSLDELLACHDQYFIHCAYQTLLGRAPDSEGLRYYLGRLRSGISKVQILAQLKNSSEGKAHGATLPNLDRSIRRYQKARWPLIGWLFTGAKPSLDRKLNAIENQIFILGDESNRRFNQLETALAGLHQLVMRQTKSIVAPLSEAQSSHELDNNLNSLTIENLLAISKEIT